MGRVSAAGPAAALIERLWEVTLAGSSVVFVLTMAALAYAVWRRRDGGAVAVSDRQVHVGLAASLAVTTVVLFAYLIADLSTDHALGESMHGPGALEVRVTGHQWWWDVEYADSVPARRVHTANEIHIPVGRPVHVALASDDVIHSLWIPALQGKQDLIPQRPTELWIQADSAGVYDGRCAEFCGGPHALMQLQVVAESDEEFRRWYDAQLQPAQPPLDPPAQRGLQLFGARSCSVCHAVRGTDAGSRAAPDLTHLASRRRIAAGTLPNTRGHLAGWVLDPRSVKPGTQMPLNPLPPAELDAVLAYLESLR